MSAAAQPLTSLSPGSHATIADICLPADQRPRLMELGLTIGTPVEIVRFAPLGDPVEIKVRGSNLSLRRHEAELVHVHAA
jgi:ferrous iron transport protein A